MGIEIDKNLLSDLEDDQETANDLSDFDLNLEFDQKAEDILSDSETPIDLDLIEELGDDLLSKEDDDNDDQDGNDSDNQDDDQDEGKGDDSLSFDDDNKDDKDEKDIELEALNKKLGTNFESVEELKNALKKEEQQSQEQIEEKELNKATLVIKSLNEFKKLDDEALVKEYFKAEFNGKGMNVSDEDVINQIEDKIDSLKDSGTLDLFAKNIRSNIDSNIEKNQEVVDKIEGDREKRKNEKLSKNIEKLQSAFASMAKNSFLGVELSNDDIKKAYHSVRSGEFFEKVNNDPGLVAKLAMIVQNYELIEKRATAPTHSDAVKKFADELGMFNQKAGKRSVATSRKRTASQGGFEDEIKAFVK